MTALGLVTSITSYRSLVASKFFEEIGGSFGCDMIWCALDQSEFSLDEKAPRLMTLQRIVYVLSTYCLYSQGLKSSSTFSLRRERILKGLEIPFESEGSFLKLCKLRVRSLVSVSLMALFSYLPISRRLLLFAFKLLNRPHSAYLTKLGIDHLVIFSTAQDADSEFFLSAASALGIRSTMIIDNWDNLSSKTILLNKPAQILVWSEQIKRHALDIQGIPLSDIAVVGSLRMDAMRAIRDSKEAAKRKETRKSSFKIGVFGASMPTSELSFLACLRQTIAEISLVTDRPISLAYRPHPAGFYSKWVKISDYLQITEEFSLDDASFGTDPYNEVADLVTMISECDVLFCFASSSFYEAVLLGSASFLVHWPEGDVINGVRFLPSYYINSKFQHFSELVAKRSFLVSNHDDCKRIITTALDDGVYLGKLPDGYELPLNTVANIKSELFW